MKLTKGKLSKIRNKKRQSFKRYKKGGKSRKSKTFRKRRPLNLHNGSLKKYKGGNSETVEAKHPAELPTSSLHKEPIETHESASSTDNVSVVVLHFQDN